MALPRSALPLLAALTLLVCGTAAIPDARAQGWTQPRGHGYYKLGIRHVSATRFYEPGGNTIPIPTLRTYTVSFYGEHGLTDRLTLVAYVPFYDRITLNRQVGRESGFEFFEGDAVSGIADADLGLRIGLVQNRPTVVSAGFKVGLPLGRDEQENGLLTGDGEWNQTVTLGAGHSFYPAPAYAKAAAGFNNRTRGYSDEVVYLVEGGYTFRQAVTLAVRIQGVASLKNGDDAVLGGTGGLYANNQQYLAYGLEVGYTHRDAYGISFSVEGATLAENVLAAPAFSVGLFVKR